MDKIKVIHDQVGHTLTIWLGDPSTEWIAEETADEVVMMKNKSGKVIGFELLHYHPLAKSEEEEGLSVETIIRKTGT
jgi:hypothetical protein